MKQQTNRTLAACVAVFIGGAALAEDRATGAIKPLSSVKFSPDNDVKCLQSAIESGDPTTGRSTLILKAFPGCVVPWHFHTAEEQLIVINGADGGSPAHTARARWVCRHGGPHAAPVHMPRQVGVFNGRRV